MVCIGDGRAPHKGGIVAEIVCGVVAGAGDEVAIESSIGQRETWVQSRIDSYTPREYGAFIFTVVETALFSKLWPAYWSEEERGAFATYLAEHPDAGDVIRGTGGLRKVRWSRAGSGKSGGVRIIYFASTTPENWCC